MPNQFSMQNAVLKQIESLQTRRPRDMHAGQPFPAGAWGKDGLFACPRVSESRAWPVLMTPLCPLRGRSGPAGSQLGPAAAAPGGSLDTIPAGSGPRPRSGHRASVSRWSLAPPCCLQAQLRQASPPGRPFSPSQVESGLSSVFTGSPVVPKCRQAGAPAVPGFYGGWCQQRCLLESLAPLSSAPAFACLPHHSPFPDLPESVAAVKPSPSGRQALAWGLRSLI